VSRAGRAVAAGLVLALAGCGSDAEEAREDPFKTVDPKITKNAETAAPRWEPLATMSGTGPETKRFSVSKRAIQWRARWRCTEGSLRMSVEPRPRSEAERPGGRCPARGDTEWIQSGPQRLKVTARGRWRVVVEQQVDTPLREPPLAAMRAPGASVIASGRFHRVERRGRGRVRLFRLPGGRLALRFDRFSTSSNSDLFVWLSEAENPRTTKESLAPHVDVGLLKSTLGDQNYLLPRNVDVSRIRSIVIWCEPVQIAYTAAPLRG
jgi:hypothetical protein